MSDTSPTPELPVEMTTAPAAPQPLRYNNQTMTYNGQKLKRGDVLTSPDGRRWAVDRQMGFQLHLDQLNEQNRIQRSVTASVDPSDRSYYLDLFVTGQNIHQQADKVSIDTKAEIPTTGVDFTRESVTVRTKNTLALPQFLKLADWCRSYRDDCATKTYPDLAEIATATLKFTVTPANMSSTIEACDIRRIRRCWWSLCRSIP